MTRERGGDLVAKRFARGAFLLRVNRIEQLGEHVARFAGRKIRRRGS